jgi:hypothetical protein
VAWNRRDFENVFHHRSCDVLAMIFACRFQDVLFEKLQALHFSVSCVCVRVRARVHACVCGACTCSVGLVYVRGCEVRDLIHGQRHGRKRETCRKVVWDQVFV